MGAGWKMRLDPARTDVVLKAVHITASNFGGITYCVRKGPLVQMSYSGGALDSGVYRCIFSAQLLADKSQPPGNILKSMPIIKRTFKTCNSSIYPANSAALSPESDKRGPRANPMERSRGHWVAKVNSMAGLGR